jgi:carboxymethylenebutenolidase
MTEIDPTQAPAPELRRRTFVGIAAAATAAASAPLAAQETLGHAHPPLVVENDPAIAVEHVSLVSNGSTVPAYSAWPVKGGAGTPSVVVVMHIWGVDAPIRDYVRRLAKSGFAAIAPDLYGRLDAPNGDGATDASLFRPYALKLERAVWLADLAAAADWLAAKFPGTKTAVAGFCMGGKLALIAAVEEGDRFALVAPFYGSVADIDPKRVHIPVCGSYGGRDTGIPAENVRAFAGTLTVPNDVKIYDEAGHAFFDDQRPSYVASAAADAWTRTIACFTTYLGKPAP